MSLDQLVERAESQRAGGVVNPLVILRMGEAQHRKGGGGQPECIRLSPAFHDDFMKSYKAMKGMIPQESADQMDLERPHLLGIPIVCDPSAQDDIVFYVAPGTQRIIIP
jgi:hypothetical protein